MGIFFFVAGSLRNVRYRTYTQRYSRLADAVEHGLPSRERGRSLYVCTLFLHDLVYNYSSEYTNPPPLSESQILGSQVEMLSSLFTYGYEQVRLPLRNLFGRCSYNFVNFIVGDSLGVKVIRKFL